MASVEELKQGTVLSASRRYADLKTADGEIISALVESKAIDIVAGDEVEYGGGEGQLVVKKVLPRKNCLARCYRKAEKKLGANLDSLFIVTAVGQLFNTAFIDRLLVAAGEQKIESILVLNKIDLGLKETAEAIAVYRALGMQVVELSAKAGLGLDQLTALLNREEVKKVALAGISGVGKSTILNKLIPAAGRRTEEVSTRTGQGRQTTSQSYGYTFSKSSGGELLLIDLPGLSSYGLTHIAKDQVRFYFPEFSRYRADCQYQDCSHLKEPKCGVKTAVERGQIANSRYESYCEIIEEIEEAREY